MSFSDGLVKIALSPELLGRAEKKLRVEADWQHHLAHPFESGAIKRPDYDSLISKRDSLLSRADKIRTARFKKEKKIALDWWNSIGSKK